MKTFFTIMALLISASVFAGNDNPSATDKEKAAMAQSVGQIVNNPDVLSALGVNGVADVTLQVDAAGNVHVESVQSDDFLLSYHIRNSLENAVLIVEDSLVGKTIQLIVNVVSEKK